MLRTVLLSGLKEKASDSMISIEVGMLPTFKSKFKKAPLLIIFSPSK